jgi:hypothetical protein
MHCEHASPTSKARLLQPAAAAAAEELHQFQQTTNSNKRVPAPQS